MKKKITSEQLAKAYELAKEINTGPLRLTDGVNHLVTQFGMNSSSARDYLRNLVAMRKGNIYQRAMNTS